MMKKIIEAKDFKAVLEDVSEKFFSEHKEAFRSKQIAVVGIHTRGVYLARRIAELYKKEYRAEVAVGSLDITLYRDDVGEIGSQPLVKETDIPFGVEGKTVLLVDDVLYTGRTIRSALDALLELGRPKLIRLLVMVDREGRELPIRADYVGIPIKIGAKEKIQLKLKELDGEDAIYINKKSDRAAKPKVKVEG